MGARNVLGRRIRNLEMVSLALVSLAPLHLLRVVVLRAWGANVDSEATIYHGFQVRRADRLVIGARTIVGDGAILDARGGLTIGNDVNLSTGVHIWTAQHAWDDPDFAFEAGPVVIEDHAWISTRVTILPGVRIGEGSVVAAGAVVTQDLAPYGLYGGVPAKKIRNRQSPMTYRLHGRRGKSWWW